MKTFNSKNPGFAALLASLALLAAAVAAQPEEQAEAAEDGEETYSNTLKWSTASEVDNFGYDVYRGDSEEGPFERLNPDPVPGAGTTDEPTYYRFVDDTIDPYKTYFYYIESISMGGVRERFTPVFPSKPKLVREGDEVSAAGDGDEGG